MKAGGKRPLLTEELFTSRALAERALIVYIQRNEKITGVAKYPGKKGSNGESEN